MTGSGCWCDSIVLTSPPILASFQINSHSEKCLLYFFFLFHYTVYANLGVIGCLWKWFPHYCPFTLFMRVIKLSTWSNHTYQLEVSLCHSRSSNNLFLRYPAGSTFFFSPDFKENERVGKERYGNGNKQDEIKTKNNNKKI